jgi:hypothetical protein
MAQINKVESIKIQRTITAGTMGTIIERIKGSGTIVEVSGKFYQGQELKLHVSPKLRKGHNLLVDLYTYPTGGNAYLAGDNQEFNDTMSLECDNDDELYIVYDNVAAFDCTISLTVTVDYYAGKARVI